MTIDFSLCSNKEIEQLAIEMTPEQLGLAIEKMSGQQIAFSVSVLQPTRDESWLKKLQTIYQQLNTTELLEAFGRELSCPQVLAILEMSADLNTDHHKKLSSVLVGLSHAVFLEIFQFATPFQWSVLQSEAMSEAIHHHLTLFIHEVQQQMEQESQIIISLSAEIEEFDVSDLRRDEVESIEKKISRSKDTYASILEKMNKALSLAWNTKRIDLIDKLSHLKEQWFRVDMNQLGLPRTVRTSPTGLWARLEHRLSSVYRDPKNPEDLIGLQEDDPAVEALAKLSLWYLEDYWKLGLLPKITDESALSLDSHTHSEKECSEYREKLVEQIYQNLHNLCLMTVRDLKAAGIYSKAMLQDYIIKNSGRLT